MFDFLDIYTTVLSMVIAILFLFCFDTVKQIDVKDCNWYVPNKCKCFRIKKHYICLFIGSWAYIFNFNLLLLQAYFLNHVWRDIVLMNAHCCLQHHIYFLTPVNRKANENKIMNDWSFWLLFYSLTEIV